MILPQDEETISRMVGATACATLPNAFVSEYETQAKMLSRAGIVSLGPHLLVVLLRKFKIAPVPADVGVELTDDAKDESPIIYDGRRGVLTGDFGQGRVGVRLDGERAIREVLRSEVKAAKPIMQGFRDSDFKKESTLPADDADGAGGYAKGDSVLAKIDGQSVKAVFVSTFGIDRMKVSVGDQTPVIISRADISPLELTNAQ